MSITRKMKYEQKLLDCNICFIVYKNMHYTLCKTRYAKPKQLSLSFLLQNEIRQIHSTDDKSVSINRAELYDKLNVLLKNLRFL